MFFLSNKGAGTMMVAPDVCLTPPLAIPVPYTNTSFCAVAIGGTCSSIVFTANLPTLNLGTVMAMSTGDEPGAIGGVASGTVAATVAYTTGSSKVFVEGLPATRFTDVTSHNTNNAPPGMQVAPSQAIVGTESF